MTREQFIEVYGFAKSVARAYGAGPMFERAKAVAIMCEETVGQIGSCPAEAWTEEGDGFDA